MRLLKNAAAAISQVVISAVFLFILYRFVVKTVGINGLGAWSVAMSTVSASRIGDLGLTASVTRFTSHYSTIGDECKVAAVVTTVGITVTTTLLLLALALSPFLASILNFWLGAAQAQQVLILLPALLISLIFSTIGNVFQSALEGRQNYTQKAVLVCAGNFIFMAFGILLVSTYGIAGMAIAQIIQSLFLAGLGWILIKKTFQISQRSQFRWNSIIFRECIGYGSQVQIGGLALILSDVATKFTLGKFGGLSSVGCFEIATQLVFRIRMLIVSANQVIVPFIARIGPESRARIAGLYLDNFRLLMIFVPPLFGLIIYLTPFITKIWFGTHSHELNITVQSLCIFWGLNLFNVPAYFSNLGRGKVAWNTIGHIWIAITNIALSTALGSVFGYRGVLLGFGISLISGSFLIVFVFQREYNIKLWKNIKNEFYFGTALTASVVGISFLIYFALGHFGEFFRVCLCCAFSLFIAMLFARKSIFLNSMINKIKNGDFVN